MGRRRRRHRRSQSTGRTEDDDDDDGGDRIGGRLTAIRTAPGRGLFFSTPTTATRFSYAGDRCKTRSRLLPDNYHHYKPTSYCVSTTFYRHRTFPPSRKGRKRIRKRASPGQCYFRVKLKFLKKKLKKKKSQISRK